MSLRPLKTIAMNPIESKIESREDVSLLVHTFYSKIRKDDLLGPIFNAHISEEEWPQHLIKLTDFWETNLFGVRKFKGSPTKKHLKVDKKFRLYNRPNAFWQMAAIMGRNHQQIICWRPCGQSHLHGT